MIPDLQAIVDPNCSVMWLVTFRYRSAIPDMDPGIL